jgi:predicted Zn-dependent protease
MHFEKNVNASIKRFRTDIKEDSHYAEAHRYGLVLALTEARRLDEAQSQLDLLLTTDPLRITYLVAQGELWMAAGKPKQATSMLAEQLRYNPGNHPLTMTYYQALSRTGDTQRAEALLSRHTAIRPNDPQLWYELAEARGLAGDIIGLHQARSEYFVLMGRPEQAIRQLNYALKTPGIDANSKARITQRMLEIQQWQDAMDFK